MNLIIVTNLAGESLPLLDHRPPMRRRNIDGTHTLSVTIPETAKNKRAFYLIEAEGKLSLDNNTYRIKQMQRDVKGNVPQTEITALHTFFDIIHNYQYDIIEGEKVISLHQGLSFAFEGTGITFIIEDDFDNISFENFGAANSLNLFEKLRTNFGFEYIIENDTFLRIRKRIGSQTQAQMRWKHNIKTIKEEVDTTNLSTYIKGYGKPKEDEEGNIIEGEYVVEAEYTSPNAHLYEELYHADPVYDERFIHRDALLNYMKSKIVDEPELSYTIEYDELQKTGVESLELGDLAFLIHEILRLDFNTRVVEVIDFPTLPKRKPIYTISSKKESMTDKQVQANADKKTMQDDVIWIKSKNQEIDRRIEKAIEAVADVENAMKYVDEEMERLENEVLPEIEQAVENVKIPKQTTPPDNENNDLWWDTSVNPARLKRWNGSDWVVLAPNEDEIDVLMEDMKKDINYNIIPSINESPTGYQIQAPRIDIKGLVSFINDRVNILPNEANAWRNQWVQVAYYSTLKEMLPIEPGTNYTLLDSDPNLTNADQWVFSFYDENKELLGSVTDDNSDVNYYSFFTNRSASYLNVRFRTSNSDPADNKVTIVKGIDHIPFDEMQGTLIDGGTIVTNSITTNELNSNEIFSNNAVIGKIRSDIILTTELNADKIVTGTLNARDVSIINLSANSLVSGSIDAKDIRVYNLNASEINAGSLAAERISAGTITKSGTLAVDIRNGEIETYSGSQKTSTVSGSGHEFYRNSFTIGNIGTSNWINDTSYRGLRFGLEHSADYMSWGHKLTPASSTYTTMLSWHKTNAKQNKGFNFSDNIHIHNGNSLYLNDIRINGYSSDNNRQITFAPHTFSGYSGVVMRRQTDGASVFLARSRAALINEGNAHIWVGSDSTGNFVRSIDIHNRHSTLNTQQVRVNNSGTLQMTSSSRRYKLLEKEISLDYAKRILNVKTKSWYDKLACEDYAHTLSTGEVTEEERVDRVIGTIAEDMHDQGLKLLVSYDEENRPDGIANNGWVLHTPLIADLYSQIDDLREEIKQIKGVA